MSRSASVVICTYSLERWDTLVAAVRSAAAQTLSPERIVVVVDHNEPLLERARAQFADVMTVENVGARGLSAARNTGVSHAKGEIVAFLDDDAVAEQEWLLRLAAHYDDERVLGVGGSIGPSWVGTKPRWFPEEFYWVLGCSYRGLPARTAVVRNVIGANMSLRSAVLEVVGGFRNELGRLGSRPFGVEETEMCIRAAQQLSGIFVYEPDARVHHRVPPSRTSLRYFCSHTFNEGFGKAILTSFVGADDGLAAERSYARRTLPTGVARGLADFAHGDLYGFLRAVAICAGLASAAAGYAAGRRTARRANRAGPVAALKK